MDGAAGFLRDICENPHDNTVRLIFADWLEENGGFEFAQFIRDQCDTSRAAWHRWALQLGGHRPAYGVNCHAPGYFSITTPEGKPLPGWLAESPGYYGLPIHEGMLFTLRRGFIDSMSWSADHWKAQGTAIVQIAPLTRLHLDVHPFGGGSELNRARIEAGMSPLTDLISPKPPPRASA